jgi:HEAT repeat protein
MLVAKNDIAGLATVQHALLNPVGLSDNMKLNLAGALSGIKDSRAVPALEGLSKSDDVEIRRNVAMALRQTGSPQALLPLSHLLDDNDLTTRYYAVVGLGEINRQSDRAPAFAEFQQRQQHYLEYWHRWLRNTGLQNRTKVPTTTTK